MSLHKQDRLSPPLDIQLETLNCTAFSVRWKMPRRHVSTITGYKVLTETILNKLLQICFKLNNVELVLNILGMKTVSAVSICCTCQGS